MREKINPEILKEYFTYDQNTGKLYWRVFRNSQAMKNQEAGGVGTGGYRRVKIMGRLYPNSHIVFALCYGRYPDKFLDHVDQDKLNNRIDNLREATRPENGFNRGKNKNNSSGFKGVNYHKKDKLFVARIGVENNRVRLGAYSTSEEAALAYNFAAVHFHGEFARLNNINLCGEIT